MRSPLCAIPTLHKILTGDGARRLKNITKESEKSKPLNSEIRYLLAEIAAVLDRKLEI